MSDLEKIRQATFEWTSNEIIKDQELKLESLRAKLADAVEALEYIHSSYADSCGHCGCHLPEAARQAVKCLERIK